MRVDIITIFPRMFEGVLSESILKIAQEKNKLRVSVTNLRDFTTDRHKSVDDRPYGGGPGMVMLAEPLEKAIRAAKGDEAAKVIHLSPQGRPLDDARVAALAGESKVVLLCSRYEGVDERLIERCVDEELSLGDYVISGGELAAMVVIDAVVRRLPGALGDDESSVQESFVQGLLDCPQYTRPETYAGERVPEVLLSGHHENIRRWRLKQALGRTWLRRPDLLQARGMSAEEQQLLAEFQREYRSGS